MIGAIAGDIIGSIYEWDNHLSKDFPFFTDDTVCTVPQALICVLYSNDFEDAIRNAISIGGDSDTLACIVGGIAEAYYKGVPTNIQAQVFNRLPPSFVEVITKFKETYKL